jgi:Fe-coproporphyrin III synthase
MHLQQKAYALFYLVIGEIKRVLLGIKYYAEVDITDNCNLRCKHCYHFKNPLKTIVRKELPLCIWEERFTELYEKGIRFMLLAGGEPALRLDIIELAYRTFPSVHIITNGQIEIPQKWNRLVIFLSLEGNQTKNDAIRGKGTFEKVFRNYTGDRRAIINMTLLKDNYSDLESVVHLAIRHSLRGVVCNFYTSNPLSPDPLFINEEERNIILKEVERVKKTYPRNFLLTQSMMDWYAKPDHSGHCYWGDDVLHFDSSWKRRRCFSGPGCANCGCFAGSFQNPLSLLRYIREAFMLV